MKRKELIQLMADDLKDRYIPFSSKEVPPVLDIGDAIGISVVILDFLSRQGVLYGITDDR